MELEHVYSYARCLFLATLFDLPPTKQANSLIISFYLFLDGFSIYHYVLTRCLLVSIKHSIRKLGVSLAYFTSSHF